MEMVENTVERSCGHHESVSVRRADGRDDFYNRLVPELQQKMQELCSACKQKEERQPFGGKQ